MRKLTFEKMWKHLRTIQTHRKWVRRYCFMAGIPWRGIKHDLSKYHPVEFFESARYWVGTSSPIVEAKKENGISYAWMHHKGHNSHHYEYWMDNFDDGGIRRLIPKNDFVELVCDYLGAARAYMGKKFSYAGERDWWAKKRDHVSMNEQNKIMLDVIFNDLANVSTGSYDWMHTTPRMLLEDHYIQKIWEKYKD